MTTRIAPLPARMKWFRSAFACLLVILLTVGPASATYFVRISDLQNTPIPPNPIKVAGTVLSNSPLVLTDGSANVQISGVTMPVAVGDFLVVEGNWSQGTTGSTLAADPTPNKTQKLIDATTVPGMAYVPAGTFQMGGRGNDPQPGQPDQFPEHTVYMPSYWIGLCEVTRGDYRQFMNAGGYSNPVWWSTEGWDWRLANSARVNPAFWDADQNWGDQSYCAFTQTDSGAVVGVMYYEAEAYCTWAGGYLPSEAQWEKAAAGATLPSSYSGRFLEVGQYPGSRSAYGCYDMLGNVNEWCRDWYQSDYYSQTPAGGWVDPQGPPTGTNKVQRGGAWDASSATVFPHKRYSVDPNDIWTYDWMTFGFRFAKPAPVASTNTFNIMGTKRQDGRLGFTLYNNDPNGLIPVGLDLYVYQGGCDPSLLQSPPNWSPDSSNAYLFPCWNFETGSGLPLNYGQSLSGFAFESTVRPTTFTVHLKDAGGADCPNQSGKIVYVVR